MSGAFAASFCTGPDYLATVCQAAHLGSAPVCRPFGFGAVVRAPDVAAPVTCIALDAKPPSCRGIKSGVVTFLVVDVAVVGVAALRF